MNNQMTPDKYRLEGARAIIESLPIQWNVIGEKNGKPVRVFNGYGHEARVTFGFDRRWGAVIDQSGKLFPEDQEAAAVEYAERTIRARLLLRLDAAERLRSDLAPLNLHLTADMHATILALCDALDEATKREDDLRSENERLRADAGALKDAFIAGFMATSEGYNGEYVTCGIPEDAAEMEADTWASLAQSDGEDR